MPYRPAAYARPTLGMRILLVSWGGPQVWANWAKSTDDFTSLGRAALHVVGRRVCTDEVKAMRRSLRAEGPQRLPPSPLNPPPSRP